MLSSITITCPKCKQKFYGCIALSMNSASASAIGKKSELFSSDTKCTHCQEVFNIYDDGDGNRRFIFTPKTLKQKIRDFFFKFLP